MFSKNDLLMFHTLGYENIISQCSLNVQNIFLNIYFYASVMQMWWKHSIYQSANIVGTFEYSLNTVKQVEAF